MKREDEEELNEEKVENKDDEEDKEEIEEKDNRSFSEKAEDKIDDVMGNVQDFFYGPGDDYANDIPATMELPNGRRVVNKVQTRRNINKRIFNKKVVKGILIFFGIACVCILISQIINKLLMS